jgi:aminotransferase
MNYKAAISSRIAAVPPSGIRKFFDIASSMRGVISLGVGEPDFNTPWAYTDAAIYSLRRGATHYTGNRGLNELCRLIARYEYERHNLEYNPETEMLVTIGASEGIDLALRAIIEPGDEVIVPDPSYVSYLPGIIFSNGAPVAIKTSAEDGFKLSAQALRAAITPRTKAIILPYPNNPTGVVMNRAELTEIAGILRDTNIIVISDEIYSELTFTGAGHTSFATIDGMRERTITLNGFSKAFAMTGWRLGYACGPKEIIDVMLKIHQYTIMCAPTSAQYAAIEALRSGFANDFADVRKMADTYLRRMRVLTQGLREAGLMCNDPEGTFYVFPSIKGLNMTSQEFCEKLLYSEKVATVPGDAFGEAGEGYIRCSCAASNANVAEAAIRIGRFAQAARLE